MSYSHKPRAAAPNALRRDARHAESRTAPFDERGSASRPVYCPTPAQILRSCSEIRAGWSPATRRSREIYKVDLLVLTPVRVEGPLEAFERVT